MSNYDWIKTNQTHLVSVNIVNECTKCVTDLDLQSKMINFEASVVFRGTWGSSGIWLEPETKQP